LNNPFISVRLSVIENKMKKKNSEKIIKKKQTIPIKSILLNFISKRIFTTKMHVTNT